MCLRVAARGFTRSSTCRPWGAKGSDRRLDLTARIPPLRCWPTRGTSAISAITNSVEPSSPRRPARNSCASRRTSLRFVSWRAIQSSPIGLRLLSKTKSEKQMRTGRVSSCSFNLSASITLFDTAQERIAEQILDQELPQLSPPIMAWLSQLDRIRHWPVLRVSLRPGGASGASLRPGAPWRANSRSATSLTPLTFWKTG